MRKYPDEVFDLYKRFVERVQREKDGEAQYRPDYEGRYRYGKIVPAIVTSLSGVEIGMLWCQHCMDENVQWHDAERWAPTSKDAMGYDTVYYP